MKTTYIYTLSDSTGVRYIGKSNDPIFRLKKHLTESKKKRTRKEKWIFSLLSKNELPILEILDEVDESNWGFFEAYWISQFLTWGFSMVNGTDGGEGSNGFKGKIHSDVTIEKCRIAAVNRKSKTRLIGESNPSAKLTENQVIEIRNKSKNGFTRMLLAKEYKVSKSTITNIVNMKRWKYAGSTGDGTSGGS